MNTYNLIFFVLSLFVIQEINASKNCSLDSQNAASEGNTELLAQLIENGEEIDCLGEWKQTLLIKSIQSNRPEAAEFLIKQGANTDIPDDEGGLALHRAAMMGQTKILSMLLAESNVNKRDERGMTPLMWSSNRNHLDTVTFILGKSPKINLQCNSGYTALTYTSSPEIAKVLLNHGVDSNLKDFRGFNAVENANEHIDRAKEYDDSDLVKSYEDIIKLIQND